MEPEVKKPSGSLKQSTRHRRSSAPEPVAKESKDKKKKKNKKKKSSKKKERQPEVINCNDIVMAVQDSNVVTTTTTTTTTTPTPKKFTRRPLSTQPPRTRASICVVPTSSTSVSTLVRDYDDDDPDWAEMASYHERRSAYSCNDIDAMRATPPPVLSVITSTYKSPRYENVAPWMSTETEEKEEDDTVLITIPSTKQLDPTSQQRYRNGVLNERIDSGNNGNIGINETHCFVCLDRSPASLMSITAVTGKLASDAIGAGGERPIYRRINICYGCQMKRNLLDPLIRLPRESIRLFKPLWL